MSQREITAEFLSGDGGLQWRLVPWPPPLSYGIAVHSLVKIDHSGSSVVDIHQIAARKYELVSIDEDYIAHYRESA